MIGMYWAVNKKSEMMHTNHSEKGWSGLDAACRAAGLAIVLP